MTRALIFVPEEEHLNDQATQSYFARRGYKLVALLRKWPFVEEMLARGEADIVVFGETTAARPNDGAALPSIAAAVTQPIGRARSRCGIGETVRLRPAGGWTPERLGKVLDSDGPVPWGLDAPSIWAARRIARALNERNAM